MTRTLVRITPSDHGERMGLEDFAEAEAQEGYLYELARGVVQVVQVPNLPHGFVVEEIRNQLGSHQTAHPESVHYIAAGSGCKLLLPGMESERHPDLAVYLSAPPALDPVWQHWTPELVVEVVSPGQEARDYREKREEYLVAGVREYWIVDPAAERFVVLRRRADQWQERPLPLEGTYQPPVLSGFQLDLSRIAGAYRRAPS